MFLFLSPLLHGDETLLFACFEDVIDSLLDFSKVTLLRHVNVLLEFSGLLVHELKGFTIDGNAGVLSLFDNGSWRHVSGSKGLFVLLVSKDVLSSNHCLG